MVYKNKAISLFAILLAVTLTACSSSSDPEPTPPDSKPLTTPQNVSAQAADQAITLAWDDISNASYTIYMGTSSGVSKDPNSSLNFMQHTNVPNPFTHTALNNGTTYYFVVSAEVDGVESEVSSEVSTTPFIPQAPQNVVATAMVNGVNLSWDNNSDTNAHYNIYMGTSSGVTTDPASVTNFMKHSNITNPFTHTGLDSALDYFFVVTTTIDGVESPISTEVSARPLELLAPQNVSAFASDQAVTLAWTNVNNVIYTVYMGTSDGVTKEPNSSQNFMRHENVSNPFTHTGLGNGTLYYFVITATVDNIESAISQQVSASPVPDVLNPPQIDSVTSTDTSVTLNWLAVNNATGYNVYRAIVNGINQNNYTTIAGGKLYPDISATSFTDDNDGAGLANGTTYYYAVTAVNSLSQSTESGEVGIKTDTPLPAAPTVLAAPTLDARKVVLTWYDNSNNEDGFRIERQELQPDNTYTAWGSPSWSIAANVVTWTDTTVVPGMSYQYRVIAFNVGGDSATWSNVLPAVIVPLPIAPDQLSASGITSNNVTLNWLDTNNPADGYILERAIGTGTLGWSPIWTTATNTLSYSDTTVAVGTTYQYRVKAVITGIPSPSSPPLSVVIPEPAPAAPSNLIIGTATSTEVPLSWSDNSDNEDGFTIQRRGPLPAVDWNTLSPTPTSNETNWIDASAAPGQQYEYQILAFNTGGATLMQPATPVSVQVPPLDAGEFLKFSNKTAPRYLETDAGAAAYYAAIDPNNQKTTFSAWKLANGFGTGADPEADIPAVYLNDADLGFGRRMYVKANPDGSVASYVENFPTLDDAINATNILATVAMEFAPPTYKTPQEEQAAKSKQVVIAENKDVSNPKRQSVFSLFPGDYKVYVTRDNGKALGNFNMLTTLEVTNDDGSITSTTLPPKAGQWVHPDATLDYHDRSNPVFNLTVNPTTTIYPRTKVIIDVESNTNTYVVITDTLDNVAFQDFSTDSRISIDLPAGNYTAVAATKLVGQTGSFNINVSGTGGPIIPVTTSEWVSSGGASPYADGNIKFPFTVTVPVGSVTDNITIDLADNNNAIPIDTNLYLLGEIGDYRYVEAVNDEMAKNTKNENYAEIVATLEPGDYLVSAANILVGHNGAFQLDIINNNDNSSIYSGTGNWVASDGPNPWSTTNPSIPFTIATPATSVTIKLKSLDPAVPAVAYLLDATGSTLLEFNEGRFNNKSLIDIELLPGNYQIVAATDAINRVADFTLDVSIDGAVPTTYSGSWSNSEEENPYSPNNRRFDLPITKLSHVTVQLNSIVDTSLFIIGLGDRKFTKFYTFDGFGARLLKVDLDTKGAKHQPGVCHICHGGEPKALIDDGTGTGTMIYPDYGDTKAGFLAWDLDLYKYASVSPYTRAEQEAKFKLFNDIILRIRNIPENEGDVSAKEDVIRGWYGNPAQPGIFQGGFVPQKWLPETKGGPVGVPDGADRLYLQVVKPTCRLCHLTRGLSGNSPINFGSYSDFMLYQDQIESTIYDAGTMPLARRTFNHFWQTGQGDVLASHLPNFGRYEAGTINVLKPGRPIANAGPTPRVGNRVVEFAPGAVPPKPVALNGKNSHFATNYSWALDTAQNPPPPGSTNIQLTNANMATPTFIPDAAGLYTFILTVNNGVAGQTSTASITVNAVQNPVLVSFANDLLPKLILPDGYYAPGPLSECMGCHGSPEDLLNQKFSKFSGYDYTSVKAFRMTGPNTYNNIIDRIDLDSPMKSLMLVHPSTEKHYYNGQKTSLAMGGYGNSGLFEYYDLVLKWILEGAKNN